MVSHDDVVACVFRGGQRRRQWKRSENMWWPVCFAERECAEGEIVGGWGAQTECVSVRDADETMHVGFF